MLGLALGVGSWLESELK